MDNIDPKLVERVADEVERRLRGRAMPPQEYFSIPQAAAFLGLSAGTLRGLHDRGHGPAAQYVGGRKLVRFSRSALVEWMKARRDA